MDDKRNTLFISYKELLEEIVPDGFVFENVAGLLNMDKGRVFEQVKSEFRKVMPNLTGWVINAEDYAIPQRRKRVILIGSLKESFKISPPSLKTCNPNRKDLFTKYWMSVEEALSDLPIINQGEDGSHLNYRSEPQTSYQKLMRNLISPREYLSGFES